MNRCFLLVLIFISMAPGLWAQSGAETIVWQRKVGSFRSMQFSHNGKYVGYYGDQNAGVIRVSDSTHLWEDTLAGLPGHSIGIYTMAFSQNDSLFAYVRASDKNLYIKYTSTGAEYSIILADSLVNAMRFIDSSRILMLTATSLRIFDYKSATFVYTEPNKIRPGISLIGKYKIIMPQITYPVVKSPIFYKIYRDSIGTQEIQFSGDTFQAGISFNYYSSSYDDKLVAIIPDRDIYPDGLDIYVYDMESLVCRKVLVPGINRAPGSLFIDADNKHIIMEGKMVIDAGLPLKIKNLIVSLEDGSITNFYSVIDTVNKEYLLYNLQDASSDSLHYLGNCYGYITLFNAVRTTSDVPMPKPISDVRIFPNPSNSGSQTISIEGISEAKSIIISDIFGRESFRSEFIQSSGNSVISFQLPSLQKGVYFISIIDGEGRKITKKLMVGE